MALTRAQILARYRISLLLEEPIKISKLKLELITIFTVSKITAATTKNPTKATHIPFFESYFSKEGIEILLKIKAKLVNPI